MVGGRWKIGNKVIFPCKGLFSPRRALSNFFFVRKAFSNWLIAWTLGPRCNAQLQTSFFKPKDSFMDPILDPFAYELHLFHLLCASQRVTKLCRNVFLVVHAISHLFWHLFFPGGWPLKLFFSISSAPPPLPARLLMVVPSLVYFIHHVWKNFTKCSPFAMLGWKFSSVYL